MTGFAHIEVTQKQITNYEWLVWHLLFMLGLSVGKHSQGGVSQKANVTENLSFSKTNGFPIKILSPYIFWYFFMLSLSQLQSLCVFRYVLIPFDFCKEMIKLEQKILLKIPHYFVTWPLVETMQRQTHFFYGRVLSFWT